MEDVLDTMDNQRPRHSFDIDDTLDPKNIIAFEVDQNTDPPIESIAIERLVKCDIERADPIIVPVDVMMVVMMVAPILIVAMRVIMVRLIMARVIVFGKGLRIEPPLNVRGLRSRIVKASIKEPSGIHLPIDSRYDGRTRV
jgi:hypothetical protein